MACPWLLSSGYTVAVAPVTAAPVAAAPMAIAPVVEGTSPGSDVKAHGGASAVDKDSPINTSPTPGAGAVVDLSGRVSLKWLWHMSVKPSAAEILEEEEELVDVNVTLRSGSLALMPKTYTVEEVQLMVRSMSSFVHAQTV